MSTAGPPGGKKKYLKTAMKSRGANQDFATPMLDITLNASLFFAARAQNAQFLSLPVLNALCPQFVFSPRQSSLYNEPRKTRAPTAPLLATLSTKRLRQEASNGQRGFFSTLSGPSAPGPDLAKLGRFCIKRSCAQVGQKFAIFVLSGPLQRASKGPGQGLAKLSYFCIKRPFTKSLKRPGPGSSQIWQFLYSAVLYKEPRKARAQIWPNLIVFVLSGPLQRAAEGPGPDFAWKGLGPGFC